MADVMDEISGLQAVIDTVGGIENPAALAGALQSILPQGPDYPTAFLTLSERFMHDGRPDLADALLDVPPRNYGRQLISVSDRNCEMVSHSQPPGRRLDEMSASASQRPRLVSVSAALWG